MQGATVLALLSKHIPFYGFNPSKVPLILQILSVPQVPILS